MQPAVHDERTVLCFGDSNTWGFEPGTMARYPRPVRWPGVLGAQLGSAWHVVEAGLNGRTTVFEDPLGDLCGRRHLGPVLASAAPVEVVVVALGTNDLKTRFGGVSAYEIAEGAALLVDAIAASGAGPGARAPGVVVVAPPPIASTASWQARDPAAFEGFDTVWQGGRARSQGFARQFGRIARLRGAAFVDAGAHVASSEVDGIHLSPAAHADLGRAIAAAVRERWP